jgi:beta-glucanase (GH16 family)
MLFTSFILSLAFSTVLCQKQPTSTVIPTSCFNSQAAFSASFNDLYPWGTDHNGAARMNAAYIKVSNGVLTLTAQPVSGQPPAHSGGQTIAINYLSGTVYAKDHFTVVAGGGYDFIGDFQAPVAKGTWPAFWLTAVNGWPPEIDLAEWKGSGLISFNTFNTSSQVASLNVNYPTPGSFHTIKAEVRDENGKDVSIQYFLNGALVTTQYGKGFVGAPMYL